MSRRVFGLSLALLPAVWSQPSASGLEALISTELGTFRIEFAPDKAPRHVDHFLSSLARILRRQCVSPGGAGGMIQGGDPLLKDPNTPREQWGVGGLSLVPSEFSDLKHKRGTVSTVSISGKADSDGAQFFVCVSPQPALDGKYSAFGRVVELIEVVERISQAPVDEAGLAVKPVRITKVTIEPKKREPFADGGVDEVRRTVTLKTTLGAIRIAMEPDLAPSHVRNFLKLVSTGWHDGTAFHRVIRGFVAQGGMPNTRAESGGHPADRWVRPLKGEFNPEFKHTRGVLSMARTDDPDSATTSFFLMLGDAPHLDGQYSAFARVVEGLEVLDAFEAEELDGEAPKRRLEILKATVDPAP